MRSGDEAITRWQYFADSNQAVIRVPVTDAPGHRGERYWGHSAGWIAASPGCADWADEASNSARYRQVNKADVAAILAHIDRQPGGVFRERWRFWDNQAHRWSMSEARQRTAKLEADIADMDIYDTWGRYRADRDELSRLRAFTDQQP